MKNCNQTAITLTSSKTGLGNSLTVSLSLMPPAFEAIQASGL